MANVLIIDDDPALRRLLRLTLQDGGFDVVTAANGVDGLEHIAAREPDVIVLDLKMPVMDGRTFYGKLREGGYSTPVVILSAFGAREAGRALGAEAYMDKPFDPNALLDEVKRLAPAAAGQ